MLDLVLLGLAVLLTGILMVAYSAMASGSGRGEVRGGGVVLIGPIPIVFGSDAKWASLAVALAIVLVVLSLLFYLV